MAEKTTEKMSVKKRISIITNELRVSKDGKNTFSNYNYFKPDDIFQKLNPLLEKYNLISPFNLYQKENIYEAILTIEDTDSEDKVVYHFDISKAEVKGANAAQNSGATLTYAKRYSLMNAFNIADNDDDFDSDKKADKGTKPTTGGKSGKSTKTEYEGEKSAEEMLKDLQTEVATLYRTKADVSPENKEKAKVLLLTYEAGGNPYKIKELDKVKELLTKIKEI
jgi:hypothetical protein